jgi:hypothetical protein
MALTVAALALTAPAQALDVVFPAGSRVGLAPPPGTTLSRTFNGFEDATNNVVVILAALPPEAYSELERTTSEDELSKRGLTLENRESQAAGKGFLVVARQEAQGFKLHKWIYALATPDLTALVTVQVPDGAEKTYPDIVIRTALASLIVRQTIPDEEQLALLPFRVGELAGFRIGGVMAGRALMLTDAPAAEPGPEVTPHFIVAIAAGGPEQAGDRGNFARDLFSTIPNLKDVRLTSAEPLRIGGQQGHQIMAEGKDSRTGNDITIVQWLRFGSSAYMHMIGVARSDGWVSAYARFRQVRDGIDTK